MVLKVTYVRAGFLSLSILLAVCFAAFAQDQHALSKKEMKELKRIFEGELKVSEVILANTAAIPQELIREDDLLFKVISGEKFCGYVLSTQAKGRYDYFDYTLFFSSDLVVENVVVTTYRSTHGAAICQKKWLGQFRDYNGQELKLGDQIDALSGATLSAESITKDIQRSFALLTKLKEEGMIP